MSTIEFDTLAKNDSIAEMELKIKLNSALQSEVERLTDEKVRSILISSILI